MVGMQGYIQNLHLERFHFVSAFDTKRSLITLEWDSFGACINQAANDNESQNLIVGQVYLADCVMKI